MKIISSYLLFATLAIGTGFEASALSITPSNPAPFLTTNLNSQSQIDALINATLNPDPTLVYKQNQGGPETGSFAASYSTSFFNTPTDPQDATISYVSGPDIKTSFSNIYLLVKDGNQTPAAYLFNISSLWNGTDPLVMTGFWPQQGAISHVSIYASGSGSAQVPDGGTTVMLLGSALAGLGALRRFVAR
jgi:hypothetical protein